MKELLFLIAITLTGVISKQICDKKIVKLAKSPKEELKQINKDQEPGNTAAQWFSDNYRERLITEITNEISKTENLAKDLVKKDVEECLNWIISYTATGKTIPLSRLLNEKVSHRVLKLLQNKLKQLTPNHEEIKNRDIVLKSIQNIDQNNILGQCDKIGDKKG